MQIDRRFSRMTRRGAMKGVAAASLALGLPAILRAAPSQMVVATGGGKLEEAYQKSVYTPWTAKTGIKIVGAPNTSAKLKAMVEQKAYEWDICQVAAEFAAQAAKQGLLEPLDYGVIDKSKMLPNTCFEHFIVSDVVAYHIAWNTKNVKPGAEPKNWAEFWKAPGRRGLWKRPFQTMEVALMADGVDKDKLYPLDVDRALKSLDKIKASTLFWNTGAQSAQILIDGEVEISATWNGRVHDPKRAGAPVDYHYNQALFVSDAWAIPKGAPNKKEAMEMIALAMSPRGQADFAKLIPYGPTNTAALALLDAPTLEALPSSEANFKKGVFLDVTYWADNGDRVGPMFEKWVL
ncbi:MAG: ABC transporter substrate-binding protein [Alphaproteobacteria bacterium]|nr:ABC transporter substrate-binding protein [Alphaproteobacteria bacterium]